MKRNTVIKEMNGSSVIRQVGLPVIGILLGGGLSLVLGALYSALAGIVLFLLVIFAGRWIYRNDSKLVELFFLSLQLGIDYDPALMEDLRDFPDFA